MGSGRLPSLISDVVANRLRRIDDLHAQGLITDEERAEQRASVLNDL